MFIGLFSVFIPKVKATANQDSITSGSVALTGVTTNQGISTYCNGYDIFVSDNSVFFYSGNGSYLAYRYNNTAFTGTYYIQYTQTKEFYLTIRLQL